MQLMLLTHRVGSFYPRMFLVSFIGFLISGWVFFFPINNALLRALYICTKKGIIYEELSHLLVIIYVITKVKGYFWSIINIWCGCVILLLHNVRALLWSLLNTDGMWRNNMIALWCAKLPKVDVYSLFLCIMSCLVLFTSPLYGESYIFFLVNI